MLPDRCGEVMGRRNSREGLLCGDGGVVEHARPVFRAEPSGYLYVAVVVALCPILFNVLFLRLSAFLLPWVRFSHQRKYAVAHPCSSNLISLAGSPARRDRGR